MVTQITEVPIDTPEKLGEALRVQRVLQGLDLDALAAKSGIYRQAISRIEKGNPNARIATVLAVMRALGIPLPTMLTSKEV